MSKLQAMTTDGGFNFNPAPAKDRDYSLKPDVVRRMSESQKGRPKSSDAVRAAVDARKAAGQVRLYKFEGGLRSLGEIARLKSIPVSTLKTRLNSGWTFDDAISKPPIGSELVEIDGRIQTAKAWRRELGVAANTYGMRVARGMSPKDALLFVRKT